MYSDALDTLRFPLGENEDEVVANEIDEEIIDVNGDLDHRDKLRKMACHDMITK